MAERRHHSGIILWEIMYVCDVNKQNNEGCKYVNTKCVNSKPLMSSNFFFLFFLLNQNLTTFNLPSSLFRSNVRLN